MATEKTSEGEREPRHLDARALKALAHPLRVQIFQELAQFGPLTASGLGERLGESSGSTSYHLRELAKYGFVREVEGKGTARERWWERTPGSISVHSSATEVDADTDAASTASTIIAKTWHRRWFEQTMQFLDHGDDVFDERWMAASQMTTASPALTIEQAEELGSAINAIIADAVERYRGQAVEGTRRVQVQFNIYPLIDTKETRS